MLFFYEITLPQGQTREQSFDPYVGKKSPVCRPQSPCVFLHEDGLEVGEDWVNGEGQARGKRQHHGAHMGRGRGTTR